LENKKKKRKPSPPCRAGFSPCRGHLPPPPLAPALPPYGPLPACSPAPAATPLPSLSLADEPAPPVSHSLSLADRPHRSAASSSSSRTTHRRPLHHRPLAHPLAAQESLAPPRPRRLTPSLPGTAPAVRSRRRRCAALMPALCTSPAPAELRRSPSLGRL
jgi:hypothetical protein